MTTSRPITRLAVANRGEIARRVFATCRRMGIGTLAVHSDVDADAPHVGDADRAVGLPGDTSAQTYLDIDAVVAAVIRGGADAVHPGYGFLSENAQFAQAVIDAGLTWVGPPPAAITAMGSKVNAKAIMANAGVPILGDLDPQSVTADQLPVLIKASAGGGGRGMRIVRDLSELADEVNSAAREAESAFGDTTVFCEPYVERGHHIEVQILADSHGTVWAVGERECSIQRRHQKIIEEAPAPLVERIGPQMREQLFAAARTAATAIDYVGAGTVEFLADDSGRFYFLEMNTRLQVEHPVTEATTGVDLVAWQIRIADGERLPPQSPEIIGHSIEARLYAEDPKAEWAPQSGDLHRVTIDADECFDRLIRPGIRVDSGVESGSVVSVFYDPMLAKVISWAPDRRRSAAMLAAALQKATIHGPGTNRDLLVTTLRHDKFLSGDTDTSFIDQVGLARLSRPLLTGRGVRASVVAAALAAAARERSAAIVQQSIDSGWRNMASSYQTRSFRGNDDELIVRYRHGRNEIELPDDSGIAVVSASGEVVTLVDGGVRRQYTVAQYGDTYAVDSEQGSIQLVAVPRFIDPASVGEPGSLLAPMPGAVVRVEVNEGDTVTAGQALVVLEAMKMEHTIRAPADGIVGTMSVTLGQQLAVGDVLAVITETQETS